MIKEEKKLRQTFGNGNHFTVPNDYFASFANKMMEQLPERDARIIQLQPRWQKMSLRKIAAAACGILVIGASAGLYFNNQTQEKTIPISHHIYTPTSDDTFNEVVDYTMLDNQDIYASLMAEY